MGAEAASAPASAVEECGIDAPVRLSSITVLGGDVVSLPDRPLVACEFAATLADYVRLVVAPLGQAMPHAKVAAIETGPGYQCRTQDRIAGANSFRFRPRSQPEAGCSRRVLRDAVAE